MLCSNNGTIQEFGLVAIYFVQFLHFGSNSSAGSNPGVGVRTLSWEFVSRCCLIDSNVIWKPGSKFPGWTVVTTGKNNSFSQ